MQSQSQARDPNQLPDDGHTLTTTLNKYENDSYYSNRDIAILHSIVAAAQHQLDHGPDPQPLPAAVLFKAYDDVLPDYGIDPDSDYHLSAFVFRIGGEQGHGTLFDKFQVILGRMGVELEFGDGTTISARTSPSSSPAQLCSGRLGLGHGQRITDSKSPRSDILCNSNSSVTTDIEAWSHAGDSFLHRRLQAADHCVVSSRTGPSASVVGLYDDTGPRLQRSKNHRDPREDVGNPLFVSRRPALVSALDLLRNHAATVSPRGGRRMLVAGGQEPEPRTGAHDGDHQVLEGLASSELTAAAKRLLPVSKEQHSLNSLSAELNRAQSQQRQPSPDSPVAQVSRPADDSLQPAGRHLLGPPATGDIAVRPAQQDRLLHRAARARQIYLASKVFNRWADRTASRLEREAVARRHMIRFRCFRGWSEVPSSKLPAADNLRAATAVQKLRRAVMHQEKQLSLAASTIAGTYRVNLARRVFEQWACRLVEHAFRHKLGKRSKLVAARDWRRLAWENTEFRRAAMAQMARRDIVAMIEKWSWKAAGDRRQLAAAQQVEPVRQFLARLRKWLGQTKLKRRSLACERHFLMEQTSMAFDAWNLRARAQALRWRCEYSTATSALETWLERTTQYDHFNIAAQRHHELTSKAKLGRQIKQLGRKHANLAYLQDRARLYIGGNLLLKTFARTARERKTRMKGSIRRYLMLWYTQVSSKRRRRAFLAALDHWRTATAGALDAARTANDFRSTSAAERRLAALANWGSQAAVEQQAHFVARNYCREGWLRLWDERSTRQSYLHAQAWRLWSLGQERLCFKTWSIATLQRSGQAHTAIVARQRHGRENRSRVLQRWKASSQTNRRDTLGRNPGHADGPRPLFGSRNRSAGRVAPGRPWSSKQIGSVTLPMETPTRWTGLPVPMTNALSSRLSTIIGEADDGTGPATGSFRGAKIQGPRHGRRLADSILTAPTSPSTTPLDPLQAQLKRRMRAPYSRLGHAGRSELGRPVCARPDLQPNDPWHTPAKSAEDVGSLLGGFDFSSGSQPLLSAPGRVTELRRAGPRQYSQSASVTSAAGRGTVGLHGSMPQSSVSRPPGSAQQRDTADGVEELLGT